MKKPQKGEPDRVTVTLGPGQREVLQKLADHNDTTLAFVVRYAIKKFIDDARGGQLTLQFPSDWRDR